jgi:hypothetical protein
MRSNALSSICTVLLTTVCIIACAIPASAFPPPPDHVLDVPAEYATIALALADAASGDTVRVAPNTYYESGLVLSSGVTLMSADWNPETTVIDGAPTRGTILSCFYGTTGAIVAGIGFAHGNAGAGGAVYCDNASVLFDYCIFTNNSAGLGGAIFWTGGTPEIYGCTFADNSVTDSGGGLYLEYTDGSVTGCNFEGNLSEKGAGVLAYAPTTTTTFTECGFFSNIAKSATLGGGGVFCENQAAPTFIQCRFDGNDATYGGGAYLSSNTEATFTNCEFEDNWATNYGGAAFCYDEFTEFSGCGFLFNQTGTGGGGALYFMKSDSDIGTSWFYMNEASWGGAIGAEENALVAITGCTIVENITHGAYGGAGLHIQDNATATIGETIIAFNTNGEAVSCLLGGVATLTCSCLFDNDGGDWVDCIAGQETSGGNMTVNPLFCALAFYDLYLCADSPCLPALNDCGLLFGAFDEGCAACGTPVNPQVAYLRRTSFRVSMKSGDAIRQK